MAISDPDAPIDLSGFQPLFQICKLLHLGKKIEAIKLARKELDLGLKDAKDMIDAWWVAGGFDESWEERNACLLLSKHVMPRLAKIALMRIPAGSKERKIADEIEAAMKANR